MKVALASDVHLEFGQLEIENTEGADVLILSGDICVAKDLNERVDPNILGMSNKSNMYHAFFQKCSEEFKHVIYIAGNHEHYHGDFAKSIPRIRANLAYLKNLHVLDKEYVAIDDVTFIGGTLWTDMNKEDPSTLYGIKGYMNDYRIIENSNEVVHFKKPIYAVKEDGSPDYTKVVSYEFNTRTAEFSPEDSVVDHKAMLAFIADTVKGMNTEKFVVVGHHSPSKLSTKPQYEHVVMVNGAYSSDLSEFILEHPQIKMWTHGHTHHKFDYMIGSTRIVCNPRGYIDYEPQADNFKLKYMEI
jgi:dTDP-4-dehydrorhamnose 3,5-epimerase-like enzyme